jgi:predicted DNA-binding WGR domain protein
MKLIKRTTLLYQEGNSDKVYEVDLCQTSQDLYVVNFRYGRRGTNLKEGVKTTQAVPEAQAQKVFEQLVASKVKKGYRDVTVQDSNQAPAAQQVEAAIAPVTNNPRHQAILNRLVNRDNNKWPLERAIWRAGELKIREATPLLIQLIGTGEALRDYCIVWALGWCGDESAIPALRHFCNDASTPEFVQRIAFEALLKLSDEPTRVELRSQKIEQLPSELRDLARNDSTDFSNVLSRYLDSSESQRFVILDTIYQIDNEHVRPALLDILRTAPLRYNYFQRMRHIFKIAEYRQDAEVFGILAYRFEKEQTKCRIDYWGDVYLPDGRCIRKHDYRYDPTTRRYESFENPEFKEAVQRVAYTKKTREYLIRRVWRTLKTIGEDSNPDYVNMAIGILLQYSDSDAVPVKQSAFGRYNWQSGQYDYRYAQWDAYAGYLTFNHILYGNSPRYVLMTNSKAWRCREGYKPGDAEPEVREEAFPKLWEQRPDALLQLLLESNCRPVHQFAVKALRACQQFLAEIDNNTLIKLVNQPYEITAELGFELASDRYNPTNPNLELILALANCFFPPARTQAHQWIEAQRQSFLENSNAIAALVTSQHSDTRAFARRLLSSSILSETTAKVLIGRIIANLLCRDFTGNVSTEAQLVKEIAETLLISFTPQLRTLGIGVVLDLLQHPMPEIQELGARILLNHQTPAADLPPELIELLIASPFESVRGIGVRIFGQLPDERLLQQYELLLAMATHELADMREAIRPVLLRLGSSHPAFVSQLATALINLLLNKEKHEGIHSYLLLLLREDLPGWMSGTSRETAMRLLKAKSSAAQELGGLVLSANHANWTHDFETLEIVKLASHEILSVREAARQMFGQILNRIRTDSQEKLAAVRLLEAKWEDSREFAQRIFSTEFTADDWTPEVMVSICDSIREDVRQFGRDLVTGYFQERYGQDYLLKFSEHPSADMQLFATNYLENYAGNNPERLRELMPYFVTVLCQVNRGRVAKQRVFAFLEAEAQKSEETARIVAEILTRQSVTMAIGDKATAIQTMLRIHQTYPQIPLPIQVKPVAVITTDKHR